MDMKLEPVEPEMQSAPKFDFTDFSYYEHLYQEIAEKMISI
jgi:hypothetical protein